MPRHSEVGWVQVDGKGGRKGWERGMSAFVSLLALNFLHPWLWQPEDVTRHVMAWWYVGGSQKLYRHRPKPKQLKYDQRNLVLGLSMYTSGSFTVVILTCFSAASYPAQLSGSTWAIFCIHPLSAFFCINLQRGEKTNTTDQRQFPRPTADTHLHTIFVFLSGMRWLRGHGRVPKYGRWECLRANVSRDAGRW